MFDFVSNNRQVVSVSLGLVAMGLLVGGGVAGYSAGGVGESYLAKVDGHRITDRDVSEMTHGQTVPENVRPQIVQQLVQKQILLNEAAQRYVVTSDARLRDEITGIEAFKKDGQFSPELYKQLLAAQQMTVEQFEKRLREESGIQLLALPLNESNIVSKASASHLLDALATSRDVAAAAYEINAYLGKASVSDAEIKQYYDAHHAEFNQPERVKVDYAVLSRDDIAAGITVDDAKVAEYYKAHLTELAPEERRVRHILIKADAKAPAAEKQAAKQKAEQLLAQVKKDPSRFAELAKQNSQDPGSAAGGGDLGYFGHGAMVKPFDDVAFKLAKGEISGVVETQFGYHILMLEDIKTKTLDELKPTIVARLQHEMAQQRFQDAAEKFGDMVYQQADSLKPAADAFKLQIRSSDWVTRDAAGEPVLNDPKVRTAAFSDDVLLKKHNSEAIEATPGNLVAVHVTAHELASLKPLAQVSAGIADKLKQEKAAKMAKDEGQKALAALQKGETPAISWQPAKTISRLDSQGLDKDGIDAVFGVAQAKLPGYAGEATPNGYVVYKVSPASKPSSLDAAKREGYTAQIGQAVGNDTIQAYLEDLRQKHKVETK